jgi:hypothetical protein
VCVVGNQVPDSKLDGRHTGRLRKRGRGGGEEGEGAEFEGQKAWSSIIPTLNTLWDTPVPVNYQVMIKLGLLKPNYMRSVETRNAKINRRGALNGPSWSIILLEGTAG